MKAKWLLVDLGNSRIKWAWLREGRRGPAQAQEADKRPAFFSQPAPAQLLICSVACETVNATFGDWCRQQWQIQPQWFRSSASFMGVTNAYREPERLGNDRWLAMIAARHLFGGPLIVVDAGTAMTIDLVDAKGQHQGGWILPGLGLQQRLLLRNTDIQPLSPEEMEAQPQQMALAQTPDTGPGLDTRGCIASGTLASVAGALEFVLKALDRGPQWREATLVLSGGEASIIAPCLSQSYTLAPELLLDGLALVAQHLESAP